MALHIASLPLPTTARNGLLEAGFHCVSDVLACHGAEALARASGLPPQEARAALAASAARAGRGLPPAVSAAALRERERLGRRIPTSCPGLDAALGGGVRAGHVTLVAGPPGSGKTTLCLRLALNARLATGPEGRAGCCLFIDTELGVDGHRVEAMAREAAERLWREDALARRREGEGGEASGCPAALGAQARLLAGRVGVARAPDLGALAGVCENLEAAMDAWSRQAGSSRDGAAPAPDPPVALVVVDSLAGPLRSLGGPARAAARAHLSLVLGQVADRRGVAVVVVDHSSGRRAAWRGAPEAGASAPAADVEPPVPGAAGLWKDGKENQSERERRGIEGGKSLDGGGEGPPSPERAPRPEGGGAPLAFGPPVMAPAPPSWLGDPLAHVCPTRITLDWNPEGGRVAWIGSSAAGGPSTSRFEVGEEGLLGARDPPPRPGDAEPAPRQKRGREEGRSE